MQLVKHGSMAGEISANNLLIGTLAHYKPTKTRDGGIGVVVASGSLEGMQTPGKQFVSLTDPHVVWSWTVTSTESAPMVTALLEGESIGLIQE